MQECLIAFCSIVYNNMELNPNYPFDFDTDLDPDQANLSHISADYPFDMNLELLPNTHLSSPSQPAQRNQESVQICPFFLEGQCKYGDKCWNYHPPAVTEVPGDAECCVCLQKIKANNKQFGLLLGCPHVFCLPCIREWRGRLDLSREVVRSCPVCRVPSYYILPSSTLVLHYQEKMALAEDYKKHLGGIPCRYFNFGEGDCPFGSSCFYDHRYKSGKKWVPPPPQFVCDEDGIWQASRKPKLSDLISRLR